MATATSRLAASSSQRVFGYSWLAIERPAYTIVGAPLILEIRNLFFECPYYPRRHRLQCSTCLQVSVNSGLPSVREVGEGVSK